MTGILALWLPILVSAVFVFVVSSVIHMAVQWHKGDYRKLPDEDAVLDAIRKLGVPAGQFMFPCAGSMAEFKTPAMQEKFKRGPVGMMIVRSGMSMNKSLAQWFAFCIVCGICVAYVTGLGIAPGPAGGHVFRVAGSVAVICHAFTSVNDSIWKGVSWPTTWKFVVDGVLYGLVTGAAFAWLWPVAA
jgi:hypothetical protein